MKDIYFSRLNYSKLLLLISNRVILNCLTLSFGCCKRSLFLQIIWYWIITLCLRRTIYEASVKNPCRVKVILTIQVVFSVVKRKVVLSQASWRYSRADMWRGCKPLGWIFLTNIVWSGDILCPCVWCAVQSCRMSPLSLHTDCPRKLFKLLFCLFFPCMACVPKFTGWGV